MNSEISAPLTEKNVVLNRRALITHIELVIKGNKPLIAFNINFELHGEIITECSASKFRKCLPYTLSLIEIHLQPIAIPFLKY